LSSDLHHEWGDDLRPLDLAAESAARPERERLLRGGEGGTVLDRPIGIEDIPALTEALVASSRGQLERLRGTTTEIEAELRRKVDASLQRIRAALDTARSQIASHVAETERRSQASFESAEREGFTAGEAAGRDAGHREGFEAGYSEGLEKGLREGRESATRDHAARLEESSSHLVETLTRLLAEMERESRERREHAQGELLSLAREIAHRVIRREAEAPEPLVLRSLETAIDRIENRHEVTIEIHPEDRAAVEAFLPSLHDALGRTGSVTIVDCERRERGGVVARTEACIVDQSIETQLALIEERLGARMEATE